jgi:hypothetical protein
MAEGAREIWGLDEWSLAAVALAEPLRFLAGLSPAQREQAISDRGLPLSEMSPAQQQRFLALAFGDRAPLPEAVETARLYVKYCPSDPRDPTTSGSRLAFSYRPGGADAAASITFTAEDPAREVCRDP